MVRPCWPDRGPDASDRCQPLALMHAWNPRLCYHSPLFATCHPMIETNPIRARIADLRERVESLRGYL
jgi:hypothetical protein